MVNTHNKQQTKKAKTTSKRKQPVKPTAAAPQPPSVNHCFLTTPAKDCFKDIRGYRVIQERAFLLKKTNFVLIFV